MDSSKDFKKDGSKVRRPTQVQTSRPHLICAKRAGRMSLEPGTLLSGAAWSMLSCLSPSSNLSTVFKQPWAQPWLAYSETPWTDWLQSLLYCATPHTGKFLVPLEANQCIPCHADWCRSEMPWFTPWDSLPRGYGGGGWMRGPATGFWVSNTGWIPDPHLLGQYGWFSPSELLGCLSGRVLVFEGDSLLRQIFLRLIWWLRGTTHLVEHFFHRHAIYTFNATDDHFVILGETNIKMFSHPTDHKAEAELLRLLKLIAASNPTAAMLVFRYIPTPRLLRNGESGALYRSDRQVWSRIAGIVRGNFGNVTVHSAGYRTDGLERLSETFSWDGVNAAGGAAHFFRRVRLCAGAKEFEASCKLDGEVMLARAGQKQHGHEIPRDLVFRHLREQDIHFDCSFHDDWPNPIIGFKFPENGDCRGILTLNMAQAILNRIDCRSRCRRTGLSHPTKSHPTPSNQSKSDQIRSHHIRPHSQPVPGTRNW